MRLAYYQLLLLVAGLAVGEFGLGGQLFQLSGRESVNNAKLTWATVDDATSYRVQRSTQGGGFATLATVRGNAYDSYDLATDAEHDFRITALSDNETELDKSSITRLRPFTPTASYSTFYNTEDGETFDALSVAVNPRQSSTQYRYRYVSFANNSFSHFNEETSVNGGPWGNPRVVMTNVEMCAGAGYRCKLERIQWKQHPTTKQWILWAHLERYGDYSLAQVVNLHSDPGAEKMTFGGAFRPLGHDSRDVTFYNDGNSAYLISSTDNNSDMNIFSLSSDWTKVSTLLTTVNINKYREAPGIVRSNGWYYMFTSRASGWLPSGPQYITSRSMAGPWSNPVNVANTATFASQSGGIRGLSNGQVMMYSDRWSASWPTPGGPTRQLNLPISLSSNGGFATYHFYPVVKYSYGISTPGQAVFGVQSGRIVSLDKTVTSNAGSTDITVTNDGTQDDPVQVWKPTQVPFWWKIDLGIPYTISRLDLTTRLVPGSETFYQYTITGSVDDSAYDLLADQRDNTDPGFSASFPTTTKKYRYIRINVDRVINNVNGNSANWAAGFHEALVYGY